MATDLAEFLGAAIGFNLLLGIEPDVSTVITAFASFAILGLQRYGFRLFEAVIAVIVGVIGDLLRRRALLRAPRLGAVGRSTPSCRSSPAATRCCSRSGSSARP